MDQVLDTILALAPLMVNVNIFDLKDKDAAMHSELTSLCAGVKATTGTLAQMFEERGEIES